MTIVEYTQCEIWSYFAGSDMDVVTHRLTDSCLRADSTAMLLCKENLRYLASMKIAELLITSKLK